MVDIIEGANVRVDGHMIIVKGSQGEVKKTFSKLAAVKVNGSSVEVSADKALKGTIESMLSNMMTGVTKGYSRNFKLLYAHFPVTIEAKGTDVLIKNFLGEKEPRRTVSIGTTKIQAKGQSVTVSGPDKEAVGQTVANLISAMRIKDKDGRVFQDGLYEIEG